MTLDSAVCDLVKSMTHHKRCRIIVHFPTLNYASLQLPSALLGLEIFETLTVEVRKAPEVGSLRSPWQGIKSILDQLSEKSTETRVEYTEKILHDGVEVTRTKVAIVAE